MNIARQFLHNHPNLELVLNGVATFYSKDRVIVDKEDWTAVMRKPNLFVRFHRWMMENDAEENAAQWANYEDEDMFRAFLIDQKLAE